jgi:transcriptional regulator with XRE-family HTH domain
MGVGQTLISSMERGMRPGDANFLRKLARYLGVPEGEADSLLRDVAEVPATGEVQP